MNVQVTTRKHRRSGAHRRWHNFAVVRQPFAADTATTRCPFSGLKFILLLLVLVFSLTGCGWFKSEELPAELLGRWVTKNQRYEGCYMIIEKDTIVFSATDSTLLVNTIEKVESADELGRKIYHITYSDKENIEYLLSIILIKGKKQPRLQFYNQRYLEWNKYDLGKEEP